MSERKKKTKFDFLIRKSLHDALYVDDRTRKKIRSIEQGWLVSIFGIRLEIPGGIYFKMMKRKTVVVVMGYC